VKQPEFGWHAFGGNIEVKGDRVEVTPLDSFRMRVYLAPVGLWLTLDGGQFDKIQFDSRTGAVRVGLAVADQFTSQASLRVEQPAKLSGVGEYKPTKSLESQRGAYVVPLSKGTTWVELTAKQ
jgi:hypothetical protein